MPKNVRGQCLLHMPTISSNLTLQCMRCRWSLWLSYLLRTPARCKALGVVSPKWWRKARHECPQVTGHWQGWVVSLWDVVKTCWVHWWLKRLWSLNHWSTFSTKRGGIPNTGVSSNHREGFPFHFYNYTVRSVLRLVFKFCSRLSQAKDLLLNEIAMEKEKNGIVPCLWWFFFTGFRCYVLLFRFVSGFKGVLVGLCRLKPPTQRASLRQHVRLSHAIAPQFGGKFSGSSEIARSCPGIVWVLFFLHDVFWGKTRWPRSLPVALTFLPFCMIFQRISFPARLGSWNPKNAPVLATEVALERLRWFWDKKATLWMG